MLRKSFFLVFFWKHFAKKTRFNFTERTPKSWIYGQKSQLYNVELANIMKTLNTTNPEFLIVDVREYGEIQLADLPSMNENGFAIPKINIPLEKILKIDREPVPELSKNKYLICLCHLGIRSAKACFHLKNRGYKAINVYGGIKELANLMKDIPQY